MGGSTESSTPPPADASADETTIEAPTSFLAEPAHLTLPTPDDGPREETGELPSGGERYVIEELLGRGGMASVYRAFDRQLERRVALKLIDWTSTWSTESLLSEARAQARVRHDNVLEIYEVGELEGRPYIAMSYVDGPTLAGLGELPLEAKLRLLCQVAEGLHAAHRAGLLHRDVKPSNVLVEVMPDGELKPYVADFGIATAFDSEASGATALAGTPAYMAPERLGGEGAVDRRSDVFSLGVTACEVLTGTRPKSASSPDEVLVALPADVAAIVRKCLGPEPAVRYPSARAVAEDLRRYLDGEVVEAHAASLAYRLTKFALRHRVLLAVVAVGAVLLAAALVAAAVAGVAAMRANERAEARKNQAEDLIGFMLGDLREKLEPSSRLALLDDIGKKALDYFAAVPPEELSPTELSRRTRALYQIGDVRIGEGDLEGARRPLAESLALAKELVDRDPTAAQPLFELGQSYFWVGYVDWRQGDYDAARRQFEAYLDVARRLVQMRPESSDYVLELFYANKNLGSVQEASGALKDAIETFRDALEAIESLAASDPDRGDWQFELAAAHNCLAVPLQAVGRYEEALGHHQADLALLRRLVAADPENRRGREFLGTAHTYVAIGLLPLGRAREALEESRAAVELLDALVEEDPAHAVRRFRLSNAWLHEGRAELALGELAAAQNAFRRQIAILTALVELDASNRQWQRQLAVAHYHLGLASAAHEPVVARAAAAKALGILEAGSNESGDYRWPRWVASTLLLAGTLDAAAGRPEAARRSYERALASLGSKAGESDDLELVANWLRAHLLLGHQEEARAGSRTLASRGYRECGFGDPTRLGPELVEER